MGKERDKKIRFTYEAKMSRSFFIITLALLALFPATGNAKPAELQLTVDASPARAVMQAATASPDTAASKARAALAHPGVRGMIAQMHRFDPKATEPAFEAAVISLTSGGLDTPFALASTRADPQTMQTFLDRLGDGSGLSARVGDRLDDYMSSEAKVSAKIQVVLGGTSDGYVTSAAPDTLNLDARYFASDEAALEVMAAHEVFHIVQLGLQTQLKGVDPKMAGLSPVQQAKSSARLLLLHLMNEGTANLVGDALNPPSPTPPGRYLTRLQEKFRRNLGRSEANFTQFDTLLYRLRHDPGARFEDLYSLGFSGGWDSNAYFTGYVMASAIERYRGRDALKALLSRSPEHFVLTYAEVAAEHADDPKIVKPSATLISIVRELADDQIE